MSEVDNHAHGLSRLARSLRRWDNEGGATRPAAESPELALPETDEHLLRCLGAAVVLHWNNLPTEIQRDLFESASSMDSRGRQLELIQHLGRYLHRNKDLA
jgi:hypothetical protein